ncbi:MAG: hypothetical protein QM784_28255 [Polyangiaceae bacterium]
MNRLALGAFVVAMLGWSSVARGQSVEPEFALEWQAPANCPGQPEVWAQVRLLLDVGPKDTLSSRLTAMGVIESNGDRYQLTLSIEMGRTKGSRVISSVDCQSLGKAAAVVLGLLIRKERALGRDLSDSDLGSDFQSPTPQPEPTPATPVARQIPPPEESSDSEPGWFLLRGPALAMDPTTLPGVGWGGAGAIGARLVPWRLFLNVALWKSQSKTVSAMGDEFRASFGRKSVEAWGCREWEWGAFGGSPCLLAAVDVFNASATGAEFVSQSQSLAIISAGPGLVGHWYFRRSTSLFLSAAGRIWT